MAGGGRRDGGSCFFILSRMFLVLESSLGSERPTVMMVKEVFGVVDSSFRMRGKPRTPPA